MFSVGMQIDEMSLAIEEELSVRPGTELFGDAKRRLVAGIDIADEAGKADVAIAIVTCADRRFTGIAKPAKFGSDAPADFGNLPLFLSSSAHGP